MSWLSVSVSVSQLSVILGIYPIHKQNKTHDSDIGQHKKPRGAFACLFVAFIASWYSVVSVRRSCCSVLSFQRVRLQRVAVCRCVGAVALRLRRAPFALYWEMNLNFFLLSIGQGTIFFRLWWINKSIYLPDVLSSSSSLLFLNRDVIFLVQILYLANMFMSKFYVLCV